MSGGPPPVPGGRSPEEREAARRERDTRRRTSSGGGEGPPAPATAAARGREATATTAAAEEPPASAPAAPVEAGAEAESARRRPPAYGAPAPRAPHGRRRALAALATLGVLLALGVAWAVVSLFEPFKGEAGAAVRVAVPDGAGAGEIGELLERNGVVSSAFLFEARARLGGHGGDLKPGSYRLREGMTYSAALDALEQGPPPDVVAVTVPEGSARREVAELLPRSIEADYVAATRRSPALDPSDYGAPRGATLEGFLFPAGYELGRGRPVGDLVREQLAAFRRQFRTVDMRDARSKNLTPYDVLIIASMVEREALLARERPLIASVIHNRLRQGIPLGIDATIRFATGNWERPLRRSQLAIDSPYNTRTRAGLPPGPIGSPGIDSIRAAARPARTGYLFFVVKPGGRGAHAFSRTESQFERDVARYHAERERRGGRSPASP